MLQVNVLGFSGGLQAIDTGNTSLLVRSGCSSLLVDASGSPVKALLESGADPMDLDGLVLTHAHVDHLYAFPSLIHNLWLMKREKPLIVTGNDATLEKAKELMSLFLLDRKRMMDIIWAPGADRIGDIEISSFPLFHRPLVPTSGFVFSSGKSKVSYFPDSAATPPYPDAAASSDIVFHEAGGIDDDREKLRNEGHSSGYLAGDVAASLDAGRLVLVHLPRSGRSEILRDARRRFERTELAQIGEIYTA